MTSPDESSERLQRIGRIQRVVQEDYERISSTDDSYIILNLKPETPLSEIRARYERYERFYRPENFHRLGDKQLTARAVEIRSVISEAMARIQAEHAGIDENNDGEPDEKDTLELPKVGEDARAMGEIYFRDGLTYLALGDLNAAVETLQHSQDYDPTNGTALAHLAYTRFKLHPTDPAVVTRTREDLQRAALFNPDQIEVLILKARFYINTSRREDAVKCIKKIAALSPNHPRLQKLRRRAGMR